MTVSVSKCFMNNNKIFITLPNATHIKTTNLDKSHVYYTNVYSDYKQPFVNKIKPQE